MPFAFGFVLVALGLALVYKGYKGWSWSQLYSKFLGSKGG